MKTIEEKAMEFTKNRKNVVGLPVNDLWIFEEGFVEGYIEATRWCDPVNEPLLQRALQEETEM